jgi:NAD(P)-dependent dehydrogenase (short-subunit alcohol dehydrogenase family)
MRLKEKVAIVTGGAQGIGAAYAKALAAEGAMVSICDLADPKPAVDAIAASGGRAIGSVTDITSPDALAAMVEKTINEFGSVHILVNNAAMFAQLTFKPFFEISAAEWDKVMMVNVRGSVECVKAVLPHMRRQKYGKVINISSATFHRGTPMLTHYVASKGAVIAITRTMARELGDMGIRVNCIAPGFTLSDAVRANPIYDNKAITDMTIAARAIKREEVPEDIVGTLVYLASPDSDFVTGQTIVVDGGSSML